MEIGAYTTGNIYTGDCIKLMPSIPSGAVDFVIADPPFAINFCENPKGYNRKYIVVDPFAGSGATLRAAQIWWRHPLGFEIVPEYAKFAIKNMLIEKECAKLI